MVHRATPSARATIRAMQRDFAFVQISPGRVFVGWGPFEHLPFRRPDRPAFYVTDFFLDDVHPWRHPAQWEELSIAEFAARFADNGPPPIEWDPLSIRDFAPTFESVRSGFASGAFQKIVPVLFENGRFTSRGEWWHFLISQLEGVRAGLTAYGYAYGSHGAIGATPETLFQAEARGYRTMALAGTRPVERAEELLEDPKERLEHRMVVDDIVRRLAPFGNIEVGPLDVLRLPGIAHLMTPIFFAESTGGDTEKMTYAEMVRRLHPTAALGVSPRTEAGERWLREADKGVKRRTFGAPFGVERPDRSALAIVAIRNMQWNGERVRIGAGVGMLPQSQLEREFDELRQKRDQVKTLFGIEVASRSVAYG